MSSRVGCTAVRLRATMSGGRFSRSQLRTSLRKASSVWVSAWTPECAVPGSFILVQPGATPAAASASRLARAMS